jgi:cyclic beta-1,2-glucan synthetase
MEWLRDNVRQVGESALSLRPGAPLPASDGCPRVQHLARALVAGGDERIAAERLTAAVAAFDEIQPLTMRELWRVPEALRVELCARLCVRGGGGWWRQRERLTRGLGAVRRADGRACGARIRRVLRAALQLTHEQDLPSARRALDQWLGRRGEDPEAVIASSTNARRWTSFGCPTSWRAFASRRRSTGRSASTG